MRFRVWEEDAERRSDFMASHPGSELAGSREDLVRGTDGIVITVRPDRAGTAVSAAAQAAVPVFMNKPAAATLAQLDELSRLVAPIAERVMSTSVLRFAPAVQRLRDEVAASTGVLSAHAVVRHDVGRWLRGSTPWQDDPEIGGGAIVTIGMHGVELLATILGVPVEVTAADSWTGWLHGLRSEDTATIALRWPAGTLGTVEMIAVADAETYEVTVETVEGPRRAVIPGPETDSFGYAATIGAFLDMVDRARAGLAVASPVPWNHTAAVLRATIEAAARARR